MRTGGKAGPLEIAAVAFANALIIGGGVAFAHRANGLAVALGVVAFVALAYVVADLKTAKQ